MRTLVVLLEVVVFRSFFEPGMPLAEQPERVLVGTMSAERYLNKAYGRPWYDLYDGPKPAVVGHRDHGDRQPFVYQGRVYGVGTGCCFGQSSARCLGALLDAAQHFLLHHEVGHFDAEQVEERACPAGTRAEPKPRN